MTVKTLSLVYDEETVSFTIEGQTGRGTPTVLLDQDDDLTAARPWAAQGYTVEPFLHPHEYQRLVDGIRAVGRLAMNWPSPSRSWQ